MLILLLIIAVCVLLLVLYWYIAKWFYEAAKAKGYTDKKYFWICFWLTFFGYLLVIALPDRGGNTANVYPDELPDL